MYYFWRLLGYTDEELTYKSVKEIETILKDLDTERQKAIEETPNTRGKQPLKTRYVEDAVFLITSNKSVSDCKERWRGVKGLDESCS